MQLHHHSRPSENPPNLPHCIQKETPIMKSQIASEPIASEIFATTGFSLLGFLVLILLIV
jgi:hypothetical protein